MPKRSKLATQESSIRMILAPLGYPRSRLLIDCIVTLASLASLTRSDVVAGADLLKASEREDAVTASLPRGANSTGRDALVHYLLQDATLKEVRASNDRPLLELLERVGPEMKPANGFVDPANITLELAQRAWARMREHAERVARDRVDFMWPSVERALVEAAVSESCLIAARRTAEAAKRLETWAIKCKYRPGPVRRGGGGGVDQVL